MNTAARETGLPCSMCRTNTRRDLLEDMSVVRPSLTDCCPVCVERIEDEEGEQLFLGYPATLEQLSGGWWKARCVRNGHEYMEVAEFPGVAWMAVETPVGPLYPADDATRDALVKLVFGSFTEGQELALAGTWLTGPRAIANMRRKREFRRKLHAEMDAKFPRRREAAE